MDFFDRHFAKIFAAAFILSLGLTAFGVIVLILVLSHFGIL